MKKLDLPAYQALRAGAEVLEVDGHGDKVLRLADGSFLKLFRRKRLLSSALWSPYARRFADHCLALQARGIPCPDVIAVYRVGAIARDVVHYRPLPGQTIRELLRQDMSEAEAGELRQALRDFIDRLHAVGIYFRSLHLGNIVMTPAGSLGLIDVADMRCQRAALSASARARNMKHLLRYPVDAKWLLAGPVPLF